MQTIERMMDLCETLNRKFKPGRFRTCVALNGAKTEGNNIYGFHIRVDAPRKDFSERTRTFSFGVEEASINSNEAWERATQFAAQFELIMRDKYGWGDTELAQALLMGLPPNWRDGRMNGR